MKPAANDITLALTLLVRDEADIIDTVIDFHLQRDIDVIIVTDNASRDGTREILRKRAERGEIVLFDEPSDAYEQDRWATRMARIARDDYGADRVISSDADEFWMNPAGTLKQALRGRREKALRCERRNMVGDRDRLATDGWQQTLAYRATPPRAMPKLADRMRDPLPASYFTLSQPPKAVFATRDLHHIERGAHSASYEIGEADVGTCDIVVYHFPVRSRERFEASVKRIGTAVDANRDLPQKKSWKYRRWNRMRQCSGSIDDAFREALPDARALQAGVLAGELSIDTTMRSFFEARASERETSVSQAHRIERRSVAEALGRIVLVTGCGPTVDFDALLRRLGAFGPDRNDKGAVCKLHASVLRDQGIAPEIALHGIGNLSLQDDVTTHASALFEAIFRDVPALDLVVFSEPSLCRLLPLWNSMADSCGLAVATVIMVADPLRYANRLQAEHGLPIEQGLVGWLRCALACEEASRDRPRVFLDATHWRSDWRKAMRSLEAVTPGVWPPRDEAICMAIDRDFAATAGEDGPRFATIDKAVKVPDLILRAHTLLSDLVEEGETPEALAELDTIRQSFDAACELLGPANDALYRMARDREYRPANAAGRPSLRSRVFARPATANG
ncbi:glycosyltransferase family 2 protein [Pararhizobium mangrovi]|nr:glycosyltransferase family 2 protein [Pararhizobium mangrovi]